MALRRRTHNELREASEDLVTLDDTKEEKITFGTRAPNSSDKGRFWVNQSGASGSRFYFRHSVSGTWTLV